jgi:uncharacterized Zn finger protein
VRESAAAKSRRYLVEARLDLQSMRDGVARAECRGDAWDIYRLGRERDGHEWCTCPARGCCAHLVALGLVVRRPS